MRLRKLIYIAPILAFAILMDFKVAIQNTVHYVFQQRDITRAIELLNGTPIFFGPEMTGGGHLPGPLYYILLSLPLSVSKGWLSPWYFMMALAAIAALIGWNFARKQWSSEAAAIWVVLFVGSPLIVRTLLSFLNISFIFPFAIAAFAAFFIALVGETESKRRRALFIGAFLTGLCIQLHFSVITFFIAFLLAQSVAPVLGVQRMASADLLKGIGLLLAPLVPYFAFQLAGGTWGQLPFFAGEAKDALPSLWLLMRTALNFPVEDLLASTIAKLIETLPWPLLPLALALWLVPIRQVAEPERSGQRQGRSLVFLTLIAAVPFSYWTFATIGIRYAVVFNLAALFLTAYLFKRASESPRRLLTYVIAGAALLFLAVGYYDLYVEGQSVLYDYIRLLLALCSAVVMLAIVSPRRWYKHKMLLLAVLLTSALGFLQSEFGRSRHFYPEPRLMPRVSRWVEIWRNIYRETGWSYPEAMSRVYFINHHLERDGQMTYKAVSRRVEPQPAAELPDGFFVSALEEVNFRGFKLPQIRNWLLEQNIPPEIKQAIESNRIELQKPYASDILIVPYKTAKAGVLAPYFHNNGQGYFASPEDRLLSRVREPEGVKILGDGRVLFKWNECPSRHPFCSTGAIVTTEPSVAGRMGVSVQVVGSALSQSSPWISPSWTQAWIRPYLKVRCHGREFRFPLAESIGYLRRYSALPNHVLLWGNNSILAPYHRRFEISCARNISQVTIGRAGSEVEMLHEVRQLPEAELSVHL